MGGTQPSATGGCRCGAVRYQTTGAPRAVAYCHCTDCRGFTGAPVLVWVAFETRNVTVTSGMPRTYESSPGVTWGFCGDCGAPLFWQGNPASFGGADVDITEVTIGSLDRPQDFAPDQHWYDSERLPWFDVADNLPRFARLRHGSDRPTHHGPTLPGA